MPFVIFLRLAGKPVKIVVPGGKYWSSFSGVAHLYCSNNGSKQYLSINDYLPPRLF
jgi:hypothetical protein